MFLQPYPQLIRGPLPGSRSNSLRLTVCLLLPYDAKHARQVMSGPRPRPLLRASSWSTRFFQIALLMFKCCPMMLKHDNYKEPLQQGFPGMAIKIYMSLGHSKRDISFFVLPNHSLGCQRPKATMNICLVVSLISIWGDTDPCWSSKFRPQS